MNKAPRTLLLCLLFFVTTVVQAQNTEQAKLLKRAYRLHSKAKLEQFFEDWANEVGPNDTAATDPYVAEAFKLFPVFYQPTTMTRFDTVYYQVAPYFIVQSWLDEIRVTDEIQRYHFEPVGFYHEGTTLVDSAVSFRPPLAFNGKGIVYYTEDYKKLLNDFIGIQQIRSRCHITRKRAIKRGFKRAEFLKQMVYLAPTYRGYEYRTYPIAYSIIFEKTLQRAIVRYIADHNGGYVLLEKIDGEWTVTRVEQNWNWD